MFEEGEVDDFERIDKIFNPCKCRIEKFSRISQAR